MPQWLRTLAEVKKYSQCFRMARLSVGWNGLLPKRSEVLPISTTKAVGMGRVFVKTAQDPETSIRYPASFPDGRSRFQGVYANIQTCIDVRFCSSPQVFFSQGIDSEQMRFSSPGAKRHLFRPPQNPPKVPPNCTRFFFGSYNFLHVLTSGLGIGRTQSQVMTPRHGRETPQRHGNFMTRLNEITE